MTKARIVLVLNLVLHSFGFAISSPSEPELFLIRETGNNHCVEAESDRPAQLEKGVFGSNIRLYKCRDPLHSMMWEFVEVSENDGPSGKAPVYQIRNFQTKQCFSRAFDTKGGEHSFVVLEDCNGNRTVTQWKLKGPHQSISDLMQHPGASVDLEHVQSKKCVQIYDNGVPIDIPLVTEDCWSSGFWTLDKVNNSMETLADRQDCKTAVEQISNEDQPAKVFRLKIPRVNYCMEAGTKESSEAPSLEGDVFPYKCRTRLSSMMWEFMEVKEQGTQTSAVRYNIKNLESKRCLSFKRGQGLDTIVQVDCKRNLTEAMWTFKPVEASASSKKLPRENEEGLQHQVMSHLGGCVAFEDRRPTIGFPMSLQKCSTRYTQKWILEEVTVRPEEHVGCDTEKHYNNGPRVLSVKRFFYLFLCSLSILL